MQTLNQTRSLRAVLTVSLALWGGVATAATEPVTVHSFTNGTGGSNPYASLIQARDGYLYSTTMYGSATSSAAYTGAGTVYRVKLDGSDYTPLHIFTYEGAEGGAPYAPLLQGVDGAFYGSTTLGNSDSASRNGSLFRMKADGGLTILHSFNGTDGASVTGGLVQDSAGVLYGTAQYGGSYGLGTIFSLRPDGSEFKLLYNFVGGASSGNYPLSGLTLARDGRLYGVTADDGNWRYNGTIFSIRRDGSDFKVLHHFGSAEGEGRYGMSKLVQAADGSFYGTTNLGGASDCQCGTVYRMTAAGEFTTLYSFSGESDGNGPNAEVTFGANGHLYGTTFAGGPPGNFGTAWQIDTGGRLRGLVPFTAAVGGVQTRLTPASDGRLYGTSLKGGTAGVGTIYQVDPAAFPPPTSVNAPTLRLEVLPRQIRPNGKAVLAWKATAPASCVASGAWSGETKRAGGRTVSSQATGDYTYTLSCSNPGGTTTRSATLKVREN